MGKRIYYYLALLVSVIVMLTSLVLSILFIDILNNGPNEDLGIGSLLLMILPAVLGILILGFIFLYFFTNKLTAAILNPIYRATRNIESILSGENIEYEVSYEELDPFIRTIQSQKQEIERAILKLKESEEYRRDFTANVSHELKTPLTSINGYAEMIAKGMTKEEDTKKFAQTILKEGTKLLGLIDSIISLSKLEGENYSGISFEKIDIYEIANNIVSRLEQRAKVNDVSITITGERTIINGNKRMIEDLISNLIDNAIKYNKKQGFITISVYNTNRTAMFKIRDSGMGIPKVDQERVFERFYRVDKSRSKRINGSGIGLSIVKHIVELHKGKVLLFSEVDKGTEIIISIPILK